MGARFKTQHVLGSIAARTCLFDIAGGGSPYQFNFASESSNTYWEIYFDKDCNFIDQPAQPTLDAQTSGGSIPRSTRVYVRITAVDDLGREALASPGLCYTTTESGGSPNDNRVKVTIPAVAGAASYNVWVGSRPFFEILVGNTTSTTYYVNEMPDPETEVRGALDYCQPDFLIYSKTAGVIPWSPAQGVIGWSSTCRVFVAGASGNTVGNVQFWDNG